MRRSIAYKIREDAYGGLDRTTARLLKELMAQFAKTNGLAFCSQALRAVVDVAWCHVPDTDLRVARGASFRPFHDGSCKLGFFTRAMSESLCRLNHLGCGSTVCVWPVRNESRSRHTRGPPPEPDRASERGITRLVNRASPISMPSGAADPAPTN
jgi:hypothetical protein